VRADRDTPLGWYAPYYNFRAPALSLALEAQLSLAFFWTIFSPRPVVAHEENDQLMLEDEAGQITVLLQNEARDYLVAEIRGEGAYSDSMVITT
jgi:hypothetical protein